MSEAASSDIPTSEVLNPPAEHSDQSSSTDPIFQTESLQNLTKRMAKMTKNESKTRKAISRLNKEEEIGRIHREEAMIKLGDMVSTIAKHMGMEMSSFPTIGVRPAPSKIDSPSFGAHTDDPDVGSESDGSSPPNK